MTAGGSEGDPPPPPGDWRFERPSALGDRPEALAAWPLAWVGPPDVLGDMSAWRVAGATVRGIAWMLDNLLLMPIALGLQALVGWLILGRFDPLLGPGSVAAGDPAHPAWLVAGVVTATICVVIDLAYFVGCWTSRGGWTPGMRLLGLRVARVTDGGRLGGREGVLRWLVLGSWTGVLMSLPTLSDPAWYAWLAWVVVLLASTGASRTRRGIHDRVAGSVVVGPAAGSGRRPAIGCLVLVLVAVAFTVAVFASTPIEP